MKPTRITEKTLELNICEEYLGVIRKIYPSAFWYGPSTREERDVGYDASIEGAEGYALFIQFKRPLKYYGTNPKEYPYEFMVDTHQHSVLRTLARRFPGSVKYAFPLIGDKEQLMNAIPNIRAETFFCELEDAPDLSDEATHKVEVYPDKAIFYSLPVTVAGYRGRSLKRVLRSQSRRMQLINFSEFVSVYTAITIAYATVGSTLGQDMITETVPRALFLPIISST